VDLSFAPCDEQQHENYVRAAELTALIRSLETDGVTISVGGEIGEVGKENSNEEELLAYLEGYRRELDARAPGAAGISKVSVQTGTSHGGVPLPDGSVAEVKLDFEVLRRLGEVARSYGLAGAVQHGASTLPDELFHRFPAIETAEIHLATGFQNALFEHPAFPAELHREIESFCFSNALDERKPDQTDQQFVYTTRKKAIGPFKRQLWELSTKDEILAAQRRKIGFLFTELGVNGSRAMVDRYVTPVGQRTPPPDGLREAAAGAAG
jgi:fructose/tagatose bisphosphate aldolase